MSEEWLDTSLAWQPLGYKNYRALYGAIKSGLLRIGPGKEVRDRRPPGSKRPCYQVHIGRANERLETPHDRRSVI